MQGRQLPLQLYIISPVTAHIYWKEIGKMRTARKYIIYSCTFAMYAMYCVSGLFTIVYNFVFKELLHEKDVMRCMTDPGFVLKFDYI
jgi:hypothetical protein